MLHQKSANLTGKHLCCSLFLMKLQVFRRGTLLKTRLQSIFRVHRYFPVKSENVLRILVLKNICERLPSKELTEIMIIVSMIRVFPDRFYTDNYKLSNDVIILDLLILFCFCDSGFCVQVFSCEFYEIFKNTFFTEHLRTTASALTIFIMDV